MPHPSMRFATSGPSKDERTMWFLVSDHFARETTDEWSEPVQYRFEKQEDGSYDLVLRLAVIEGRT